MTSPPDQYFVDECEISPSKQSKSHVPVFGKWKCRVESTEAVVDIAAREDEAGREDRAAEELARKRRGLAAGLEVLLAVWANLPTISAVAFEVAERIAILVDESSKPMGSYEIGSRRRCLEQSLEGVRFPDIVLIQERDVADLTRKKG